VRSSQIRDNDTRRIRKAAPILRAFTPTQISEKIKAERFQSNKDETAKAFAGIRVDWTLLFQSASLLGDDKNMLVFFVEPKQPGRQSS